MIEDIYKIALEQMPPDHIDHWCSDLYLKATNVSRELLRKYKYKKHVKMFHSNIDGSLWYDVPFAYYGENWRSK
jgi:hypothetical protein